MNIFSENLQFYRKKTEMTQEQLAEKLGVSRQTVSKWESGTAFPEMEKILQLCQMFSSSMDVLMRQNAKEMIEEDNRKHRVHMQMRRKQITCGVVTLISSVAIYELLAGFGMMEAVLNTVFMIVLIVGILILTQQGIRHEHYQKKYPYVQDFYTQEEKDRFDEKYPTWIVFGIGLILIGFLIGMNGDSLPVVQGMNEEFYYGIFMLFAAAGVGVIIYAGLGKECYDIESYNKNNDPNAKIEGAKIGAWCGCIMLAATAIFLVAGFVFGLWRYCWVVYPVGGILCGIAVLILHLKTEQEQ